MLCIRYIDRDMNSTILIQIIHVFNNGIVPEVKGRGVYVREKKKQYKCNVRRK